MMILRYSRSSPFARKVAVVAAELGISDKLQMQATQVRIDDPDLFAQNPLGKIPVLVTETGASLYDSKVICEYLDKQFGGKRLLPESGTEYWQAVTWIHLADGMTDAGLIARQEDMRDASHRSPDAVQFQLDKVSRSLDWFNDSAALSSEAWGLKEISLACALEWLIFRFGESFVLADRSRLADWYENARARPSLAGLAPL